MDRRDGGKAATRIPTWSSISAKSGQPTLTPGPASYVHACTGAVRETQSGGPFVCYPSLREEHPVTYRRGSLLRLASGMKRAFGPGSLLTNGQAIYLSAGR